MDTNNKHKSTRRRKKIWATSAIYNIRVFHNWVKNKILEEATDYLNQYYDIKNPRLLDMAVGKGGDMFKWLNNHIYNVVGIDIDDDSINGPAGANDRYAKLKKKIKTLYYEFHVFDLSNPVSEAPISEIVGQRQFDIVSCQFAIHYFFKDESSLDTFFRIATKHMARRCLFIGSTMNGQDVQNMFVNKGPKIETTVYNMEQLPDNDRSSSSYGKTYSVSLASSNDDEHYFTKKPSIEYMVDFDVLKQVGEKYGLLFLGITPFSKWYDIYTKDKAFDGPISDEEKEFSFLNYSFVFITK